MAGFKFRLAAVLRLRQRIREERQWELRALNERRNLLEAEIAELERELAGADEALAGGIATGFELRLHADYRNSLAARIATRREALARLDGTLAEKRAAVVEALRGVKSLEQLRARLEEKSRYERELEERKIADEIGRREFSGTGRGKKLPR
ncbi:MAG TPA: flagellar export protein FliJ [candidate division Zixibacteria bacterium]|nr:flagellar export protein FliJ [candidate division Zixibacteria bacterium]